MTVVSTETAKEKFSEWLEQVARTGETVVICREGKPVARLEGWGGKRRLDVDPVLARVEVRGPLYGDDVGEWEALEPVP